MQLSTYIKILQDALQTHGDIQVCKESSGFCVTAREPSAEHIQSEKHESGRNLFFVDELHIPSWRGEKILKL